MGGRYLEDVEVGETYEPDERYDVTETEIVEFGERFEPWVQHVDAAAAHESEYVEQLTAGTLHVCAMGARLLHDTVLADLHALDTVAVEDAWRTYQVLPGDSLGIRAEAVETETRGLVAFDVSLVEPEDDLTVMTMTITVAFEREPED